MAGVVVIAAALGSFSALGALVVASPAGPSKLEGFLALLSTMLLVGAIGPGAIALSVRALG